MADTDGSIAVAVDLNVSDAEKELARLKKRFLGLQSDITENKTAKTIYEKELEGVNRQIDELQKNAAKTKFGNFVSAEDEATLNTFLAKQKELNDAIEKTDGNIRNSEIALAGVKARYGELATEAERLQRAQQQPQGRVINTENAVRAGEAAQDATQKTNLLSLALEKLNPIISGISKDFATAGKVGCVMVKTLWQGVLSLAKSAANGVKKAFLSVGSAVANIGKNILGAAKNLFSFNSAGRAAMPVFTRLGSLIKNAFVFNVISQGLNYVKQQLWDYLQTNTQFMSALSQLKSALAQAFAPILSVVVPALTTLINWITSAITAVAQFIAVLFGRTVKLAKGGAAAMGKQAGAIGDIGEAAEEATKSLASFDEINTLATDNAKETPSSGGGGGAGGAGGVGGLSWEVSKKPFEDWGQAFSDFLDKILNDGIPRLREGFERFAEWFNGLTQRLYEMFTFPGVEEKVILIGQRLAEAFNHLVDLIDWEMLGRALGAGLNLALQFVVSFIYTFDWIALGGALAQMVNGLVDEVDWYAFGQLLWARFKIALESLAGFLSNLDMPALAQAASDIIMGFFDSMTETIQSIDWQHLGEQIRDFLVNIDWAGVAQSVFTAIGAGFGALGEFLNGLFGDAVTGVIEYMNTKIQEFIDMGGDVSAGFLYGILCGLADIGTWIYDNVFTPFIDGFKSVFGIASPSTVMQENGVYLIDGLYNGLQNEWTIITQFIDMMRQGFDMAWTQIMESTIQIFTMIGENLGMIWTAIVENLNVIVEGMKQNLSNAWDNIRTRAESGLNAVKSVFQSVWNGIVGIVQSAANTIKSIVDGIGAAISGVINAARNAASSIGSALSNVVGGRSIALDTGVPVFPVPDFQIPALAAGAVIPPNRSFLAMLGDQPSGTNVEAPLSTIEEALQNVLNRNGNGDINITFTGDLAQLARVLRPVIEREGKRIGGSLIGESIA